MSITPYFAPGADMAALLKNIIDQTTSTIRGLLNMYQSEVIHNALIAAHVRGVNVQLIFDRRQEFIANPRLDELKSHGIPVYLDKHERSIQSQYLAMDSLYTVTGRYLYTYTHDDIYACDFVYIEDPSAWDEYNNDWNYHQAHSVPY